MQSWQIDNPETHCESPFHMANAILIHSVFPTPHSAFGSPPHRVFAPLLFNSADATMQPCNHVTLPFSHHVVVSNTGCHFCTAPTCPAIARRRRKSVRRRIIHSSTYPLIRGGVPPCRPPAVAFPCSIHYSFTMKVSLSWAATSPESQQQTHGNTEVLNSFGPSHGPRPKNGREP